MPLTDDQVIEAIKKANSEEIERKVYDKIRGDLSPDISLSKEPLVKPGILELWIAKVTS
ncbi:hypothetical protein [Bradyrhizobium sp. Arg816]|uniref:hypothetical protein n=1 Tax=Bradyrhizobium sp. Arg816 TaxID=2998491 RepID=UPI00249F48C0|nr:hypothetical protein [Bradyrhizobium sp. Arg816]MDI3562335.1 hypothetical protein [Bradyrhizobium sp. Arg816]